MKHERAILMILTFVIGFTCAFIAFGLPKKVGYTLDYHHYSKANQITSDTKRAQTTNESQTVTDNTKNSPRVATDAVIVDGSLYVVVDGKKIIVSADNKHGEGEGFHEQVESFELSEDGTQLSYCIIKDRGDQACLKYIYQVASHVAYKL